MIGFRDSCYNAKSTSQTKTIFDIAHSRNRSFMHTVAVILYGSRTDVGELRVAGSHSAGETPPLTLHRLIMMNHILVSWRL